MTRIAVVIPSRNDAPMLAVCLAHLAAQLRPADPVIVVDNASTDDTAGVCAAAGVLRIVAAETGIAPASPHGFDTAGSEILARLDADSRPPTGWLAQVGDTVEGARKVRQGEPTDASCAYWWTGHHLPETTIRWQRDDADKVRLQIGNGTGLTCPAWLTYCHGR